MTGKELLAVLEAEVFAARVVFAEWKTKQEQATALAEQLQAMETHMELDCLHDGPPVTTWRVKVPGDPRRELREKLRKAFNEWVSSTIDGF